jgi:hypothetical protein
VPAIPNVFSSQFKALMDMRVGFVLCSNTSRPLPSTRIAVLNILPWLESEGLQPIVLFDPLEPSETPNLTGVAERALISGCDVVVLQKVRGQNASAFARTMASYGIRTVFLVCDRVDIEMAAATDTTVVISDYLKSLYPRELWPQIHVVYDGIEHPSVCKSDWGSNRSNVNAVLVTSNHLDHLPAIKAPPSWLKLRIVGKYRAGIQRLREVRWTWLAKEPHERNSYTSFLLNRRIRCVPWGPQSVYQELVNADIGIIPVDLDPQQPTHGLPPESVRKSANRLTLKMSVGLPVVATPIPAYEAIIEQGRNGFLARTDGDWTQSLIALRDPDRRREMGLAARATVERAYSMDTQAKTFVEVLRGLYASR